MNYFKLALMAGVAGVVLSSSGASADLKPENVTVADSKKTQAYVRDGLVVGGDRAVNEVVVKDLRFASNQGFERLVVDLQGTHNGEPTAIARPPFYQVAITPDEKRLVFTVFGKPHLDFDAKRVQQAFRKSAAIETVSLFPVLDGESWTFALELKPGYAVEVFELSKPVRIILDVKARKGLTQGNL